MKNIIIGVLVVIVILLGAGFILDNKVEAPSDNNLTNGSTTAPVTTPDQNEPQSGEGMIKVTSPVKNQIITSPLKVSGEAKGGWYFEASAPVKIVDANGKVLGQGPIQAQGDWMTPNFVPFLGTITFSKPETATGKVIFMNDNPSGLPENERTYSIPVRFSN